MDSVAVEAAGTLELPTPYVGSNLNCLRYEQSADVVYLACRNTQQRKIERRDNNSWSIVLYEPEDGPFLIQNTSEITITPGALTGETTLTASSPVFRQTNIGGLFRVASTGQTVQNAAMTAITDETGTIKVTGAGEGRRFSIVISGVVAGDKIQLQRSASPNSGFTKVVEYTTDVNTTYKDDLDNQTLYYKLVMTDNAGGGTVDGSLEYTGGSISGIARITGYTSQTVVNCVVLQDFGGTGASRDWWEGEWSDRRGFPTCVTIYESRVWYLGNDKIQGSESDGYEDYDDETEGDAGPINRSVGFGPIANIHWVLPLSRLVFGTADNSADIDAKPINGNNPLVGRSNSFDEPLTPGNFNIKTTSPQGVFVDRSGEKAVRVVVP